jgi:hypothetical protein
LVCWCVCVFDVSKGEGVWSRNCSHEVITRTSIPRDFTGKKEQRHECVLDELVKIGGGFTFFF